MHFHFLRACGDWLQDPRPGHAALLGLSQEGLSQRYRLGPSLTGAHKAMRGCGQVTSATVGEKNTCWAALEENTTHPGIRSPEPIPEEQGEKAGARGRVAGCWDGARGAGPSRAWASPQLQPCCLEPYLQGRNVEALTGLRRRNTVGSDFC